ncbi:hypothetical protein HBH56_090730 [Parastagonospora nodorum]|nr:hypothetical protein HBH56_090730 [Parastagonospora nodorum]QRC98248.1 hypothetical protein JI435_043290 [Parastagonospora nodorum SN15]KAH3936269.1 hypothetical protein HBH54_025370 [Parastagonospora nodorum]KAH3945533.1 hypothetical protein HBH53_142470 [Parastagonospora nodorum]KAH3966628.1 hypothetical protein HBH51_142880 [Parastagonospora nodorum]
MNNQIAQADTQHATARPIDLDSIAEDVQHLIASKLVSFSQASVSALSQSSQSLRQATVSLVYRNIVLKRGEDRSKTAQRYEYLIELFRKEEQCSVARHVRSITVKDDVPPEDLMMILTRISQCGVLNKLSWETTVHISQVVLDKLHATWPKLELLVHVLDREHARDVRHRQMDEKLLSSPLLRNLTYNAFFQGYEAHKPARSEWPKLTRAIAAGGNLRMLRIQSQQDGNEYRGIKVLNDTEPQKLMRFDMSPETHFPALEEFTLHEVRHYGSSSYLWDTEHCKMLRDSTDWSNLRTLNFASDMPTAFFTVFTGLLPELKSLRFGIPRGANGEAASKFIKSVRALESLDIDHSASTIDTLWPAIEQHNKTLETLILRGDFGSWDYPVHLEVSCLKKVVKEFPFLKRLGWDVSWEMREKSLELISSMRLEKLDLFLHIPDEASDYSAELTQDAMGTRPAPELDIEGSRKAAIKIMEDISRVQIRPLERLTLHIVRTGRLDRWEPYLMFGKLQIRRRKDEGLGGDNLYEFRGKQEWGGMGDLQEELSLEED